jgi:hypothetical protein
MATILLGNTWWFSRMDLEAPYFHRNPDVPHFFFSKACFPSKCSKGWTFECYLLCTYEHSYEHRNILYDTNMQICILAIEKINLCWTMGDSWMKNDSKSPKSLSIHHSSHSPRFTAWLGLTLANIFPKNGFLGLTSRPWITQFSIGQNYQVPKTPKWAVFSTKHDVFSGSMIHVQLFYIYRKGSKSTVSHIRTHFTSIH